MNPKLYGFWPATLVSYDAAKRTGEVYIEGITDGADRGLTAEFAYPVGESDKDTELQITVPAPVDVYFEMGDPRCPVVFAFRTHQDGSAVVGTRRIRQVKVEVLADDTVWVKGATKVMIESADVTIEANTKIRLLAPLISLNGG